MSVSRGSSIPATAGELLDAEHEAQRERQRRALLRMDCGARRGSDSFGGPDALGRSESTHPSPPAATDEALAGKSSC